MQNFLESLRGSWRLEFPPRNGCSALVNHLYNIKGFTEKKTKIKKLKFIKSYPK